ncbi:glucoamylase family protein [soil metagenome]
MIPKLRQINFGIIKFLKLMSKEKRIALVILLCVCFAQANTVAQTSKRKVNPVVAKEKNAPQKYVLSKDDDTFLEDLERRAFQFFWEHSDAKTGLTLDRARTNGDAPKRGEDHFQVASIASTGFALTSYCVAAERKWITPEQAKEKTRRTLDFFANRAFQKNGWFYHWLDQKSGERRWRSEVSSIDTALLLGGVLSVRQCFAGDAEIVRLATKIYERVDFPWMLNSDDDLLSHGWRPETGFIVNRWHDYSEQAMLYLLGIGSPTRSIRWQSWYAWKREFVEYKNYKYLAAVSPLFIHQFSHAWVDFRNKRERYLNFSVDYFENSVTATYAQRQFFIDVLSEEFPLYTANIWGLTASDSTKGYVAWGAPPRHEATDGSVVPCAPAGSLMFAPEITLLALKEMKRRYGDKIYGRYGFTDAFNPHTGWINQDVIGIDVGITLLSAENLRSGSVWRWFMQNAEIKNALTRVKIR